MIILHLSHVINRERNAQRMYSKLQVVAYHNWPGMFVVSGRRVHYHASIILDYYCTIHHTPSTHLPQQSLVWWSASVFKHIYTYIYDYRTKQNNY